MTEATAAPSAPDRFLIAIVAGAAILALLAVGAVFAATRAPEPPIDPNSPVGVARAYVEALRDGDYDRASTYLTRGAQASLASDRYRPPYPRPVSSNQDVRIVFAPGRADADTAEVKVSITHFTSRPTPFSASTWSNELTIKLVREDGAWRVSQPVEPYSFW